MDRRGAAAAAAAAREAPHDDVCPLNGRTDISRAGLIWIRSGYPTTDDFTREAIRMGVSRRIRSVPNDLRIGETWVFLAHKKADTRPCDHGSRGLCDQCPAGKAETVDVPGVFTAFKPDRVEYVVTGDESEEELEWMVKRGIRPVRVEPLEQTLEDAA